MGATTGGTNVGGGGATASTQLTDSANLPRLDATTNTFTSTNIQVSGSGNVTNIRSDNICMRSSAYPTNDIGFSATGGYRDGGAIRSIAAGVLQLSSDFSTPNTDLNLHALRMANLTTTQKNALTAVEGMIVYDSTLHALCVYNGTAWKTVTAV